jgi:hypothetical protein
MAMRERRLKAVNSALLRRRYVEHASTIAALYLKAQRVVLDTFGVMGTRRALADLGEESRFLALAGVRVRVIAAPDHDGHEDAGSTNAAAIGSHELHRL